MSRDAELEAAERECADLWDAVDKAHRVLGDALEKARRRAQDEEWARVTAVVRNAVEQ